MNTFCYFMEIALERDYSGIYGSIYQYATVFAYTGAALLTFIYLWKRGRLDMDEEAKMEMLEKNEQERPL